MHQGEIKFIALTISFLECSVLRLLDFTLINAMCESMTIYDGMQLGLEFLAVLNASCTNGNTNCSNWWLFEIAKIMTVHSHKYRTLS